jgi:PAS domain-containing protein
MIGFQNYTGRPTSVRTVATLIQRQQLTDGGWVATHEDVTEQKRAERLLAEKAAELEAMNLRFNAALNNMSQGLCMFDADQRVVVANAGYAQICRLAQDHVKPGTPLRRILDYRRQKGTHFATPTEETPSLRRSTGLRGGGRLRRVAGGRSWYSHHGQGCRDE